MTKPLFKRVAILGVGLIGGSIGKALKSRSLAKTVVGFDANAQHAEYALQHTLIDEAATDAASAVKNADLVILATPPRYFGPVMESIASQLKKGAIVMDTGSVKESAMQAITAHLPKHATFVPAHPIAGSQHSGPEAANADMFERRKVLLTPPAPTQDDDVVAIIRLWKAIGADVEMMPPKTHDLIYAHVSHLPQLLAFALPDILRGHANDTPVFKQFTRLSASSASLWADIFSGNREHITHALDAFTTLLEHMCKELKAGPDSEEVPAEATIIATVLFPRIVASCMIASVQLMEQESGVSAARYTGPGFKDFTAPAHSEPEGEMQLIASSFRQLTTVMEHFLIKLEEFRAALHSGDDIALEKYLSRITR